MATAATDAPLLKMRLFTVLKGELHFKSMSGSEEISRLFEYQVVAVSTSAVVSPDSLLGTRASVSLEVAEGKFRYFHGLVTSFGIEGAVGRYHQYRLTLRPWLWLPTRASNLRIFQDQTALEIIQAVLLPYRGDIKPELNATYAKRVYCVQYRESDFNFVSRLMEEEGIFYYFKHTTSEHTLVLADRPGTHQPVPGFETIPHHDDDGGDLQIQAITQWRLRHEVQSGKFTLNDYNFETPSTPLKSATAASSRTHAEAAYEVYDYPGLFPDKAAGDERALIRRDAQESRYHRASGQGNTMGLVVGTRFKLKDHPRADQNAEHLVLATQIDMHQAGYEGTDDDDTRFLCRFQVQSYAEPFRPARSTHKPAVNGPQTAVVVGDGSAGTIEPDEYGRVKVQFHWDRLGQRNIGSSCWLRVSSPWAGNGWGLLTLPRIGQEVVVGFLEGDPDQPLITGSVHNAEQLPPYELPVNGSVSTWKSRTIMGAPDEFNELRFEDHTGREYVFSQAQKDRLALVKGDFKSEIRKSEHRTVSGSRLESVGGKHHLSVTEDVLHNFKAKLDLRVTGNMTTVVSGNLSTGVEGHMSVGAVSSLGLKSNGNILLDSGGNLEIGADENVFVHAGTNLVIEAGTEITLKVGGSFIVIGPSGVTIKGTMVLINSGGAAGSGTAAQVENIVDAATASAPEVPVDPLAHR